jgi:hypothetical protein
VRFWRAKLVRFWCAFCCVVGTRLLCYALLASLRHSRPKGGGGLAPFEVLEAWFP